MSIQRVQSNKSYSPVKRAVKAVATAATLTAATGAVLYQASKTGKLNPKDGNKYIEAAKAALKKPADAIVKKADPIIASAKEKIAVAGIKSKITNSKVYTSVKPTVDKVVSTVSEKAAALKSKVQDLHLCDKIVSKFEMIKGAIDSKINPKKFL